MSETYYPGKAKAREGVENYYRGSMGIHGTDAEISYAYFLWLMDCVGLNGPSHCKNMTRGKESETYFRLAIRLHNTTFRPLVDHDIDRAIDGINLRTTFASIVTSYDNYECLVSDNCSMLEMLVAFAQRIDRDIMYDPDINEDRSSTWFWIMMNNCGLSTYTDEKFISHNPNEVALDSDLNDIIDTFNDRKYDWKGVGGLFPVDDHSRGDYKYVDLWYQMQDYFMANYLNPD